MATAKPVSTDGNAAGSSMRRKMARRAEPRERAASTYRGSTLSIPASTLMSMGKKAPMKVRKIMVPSLLGQNRMARGSQASGGMGRSSSSTGKIVCLSFRYVPIVRPRSRPRTAAIAKPAKTRCELPTQLSQYAGAKTSRGSPAATSPGPGSASQPIARASAHTAKKPRMPARPCHRAAFPSHAGENARARNACPSESRGDAAALPCGQAQPDEPDHHAGHVSERSEYDHSDDDVGQRNLRIAIEDQVAEAGFAGDQLSPDEREPGDAHGDLEPREDRRQRAGKNDAAQLLPSSVAEARGGAKINVVDRAHAEISIEQRCEQGRQHGHEDDG